MPTTSEVPQIQQSNTAYTTKNFTLAFLFGVNAPSAGDQADFQVQAIVGHIDYVDDGHFKFVGQASDWSSTQTVTIGNSSPVTPAPTQTQQTGHNQTVPSITNSSGNPTQLGTEQGFTIGVDWQTVVIAVLAVVVVVLALVVVLQRRVNRKAEGQ